MNTPEVRFRRILVALDASEDSRAAAAAAAKLALRLRAELEGIFVEDIDLLQSAQVPVSRQVGAFSAATDTADTRQLEYQLKAQADRARQCLAEVADPIGARWTFRVARGRVGAEVATTAADLTILGRVGRFAAGESRVGATAQTVVARKGGMTLVLCSGMELPPFSDRSLRRGRAGREGPVGSRETSAGGRGIPPGSSRRPRGGNSALAMGKDQSDAGQTRSCRRQGQILAGAASGALLTAVDALGPGILVLPGASPVLAPETLQRLLRENPSPVLVVS